MRLVPDGWSRITFLADRNYYHWFEKILETPLSFCANRVLTATIVVHQNYVTVMPLDIFCYNRC